MFTSSTLHPTDAVSPIKWVMVSVAAVVILLLTIKIKLPLCIFKIRRDHVLICILTFIAPTKGNFFM